MGSANTHDIPAAGELDVLLVEDNPADAMMFSSILKAKSPSLRLTVLHDGAEAVEHLLQRGPHRGATHPDVVLLDLNLPFKNGFEVIAETRAEPKYRDVPVYLLTTSASSEDAERAKALGVAAFLTKAVDLDEVEKMLGTLVEEEFPKIARKKSAAGGAPAKNFQTVSPSSRPEMTNEAFRQLVEAVKDYSILMLSPQGYILSWNEGATRMKQYSANEVLGKHFSIFHTPENVQSGLPEKELRIAQSEGRYSEEGWRVRRDGTLFWAHVTVSAVKDASGKLIGFGKVTHDITEQRQAEERLRLSEERFRILVEGVQDYAIFMLDSGGHVISWNRGAERIKGYKASEILGKHFSIFYTEKAKSDKHPDYELEVAKKVGTYEEEGIRIRKDGSTFWANVLITALYDKHQSLTGFAKVTRDVTERKRAEEEVRALNAALEERVKERTRQLEESTQALEAQKEELLRSNSDLQQFAYVASHDLQEPLRIVVSQLQLVDRLEGNKLGAESRKSMDFAIEGALHMRRLVLDLLSYAQIEKGAESMRPTDFNDVLRFATDHWRQRIDESQTKILGQKLPTVIANTVQMQQIFLNLMGNAISYTPPDRKPQINISARDAGDEWIFSVADNGIGIEREYWQKIFIIFQRLHSDRGRFPGTGIGLAVCKKIVERHGGKMWLDSTPGVGTTFYFSLPKK